MPAEPQQNPVVSADELLAEADRCVKCGLCLPHCPTFRLAGDEGDSPRGRIALIQGYLQGALPRSDRLLAHLDGCLGCRACESACPSDVRYGRLLDAVRARLDSRHRLQRVRDDLIASGRFAAMVGRLSSYSQRLGLQRLGGGSLRALAALLPEHLPPLRAPPLDPAPMRGVVGVFTGCVGQVADRAALNALLRVLHAAGFGVRIPAGQGCCGAIHLHAGDPERARAFAARNREAFAGEPLSAVVSVASGCGAQLAEYGIGSPADALPARVIDASRFCVEQDLPAQLTLLPAHSPLRVAVHSPCTLRNVLRSEQAVFDLLNALPGAEVLSLPGNDACCGAAGTYLLDHADTARALREPKLTAIRELAPDVVVTSNTGCGMHLRAGLVQAGLEIPVRHPLELLAERL